MYLSLPYHPGAVPSSGGSRTSHARTDLPPTACTQCQADRTCVPLITNALRNGPSGHCESSA
jgi:hypothetical protein